MTIRPLNILLVDDEALLLMNMSAMIEDLGHQPIEASNANAALKIASEDRAIDLLITDESMPGMRGVELAHHIRTLRASLPVVIATGYSQPPNGAHRDWGLLRKPFDHDELARVVADATGTPIIVGR